jgi:hypothetical protein
MKTKIEDIATPALQTPMGLLTVLIIGLGVAFMAWNSKEEIDLFFFRASGGNARIGRGAAITFPLGIVAVTLWFVVSAFI